MASFLSRLASLVITLRGSKWRFSSAERTLRQIERLQAHPASFAPPPSIARRVDLERRDVDGWPVFTVRPKNARPTGHVVYLHGGCYVFEIDPIHWGLIAKLAVEAHVTVVVPIMPLAPRGVASSVVPRVADLVEALVADAAVSHVSIVGDSSGGGMALATAQVLRDRGVPRLHGTVLISPWLDISGTDPRLAEIAPRDPWLAVPGTRAAGALYQAELAVDDPLVSPIHGSLIGLGHITMFSGTRDILNADAARLVARAEAEDVPLDYHEGEGMIHNYPILPMPEGDAARALIVAAIR